MIVPPVLEYTAIAVFTISATWVVPTAAFGSGGAQLHGFPADATLIPSKLASVATAALTPGRDCTTGSGTSEAGGCGSRDWSSGAACLWFFLWCARVASTRNGSEVSWWTLGPESED